MDFWVSIGINVLLEALKDRKAIVKFADAIAKLYVNLERAVATNPTLAGAVEKQRNK